MTRYLTADGMLGGTGLRDTVEGDFLIPEDLGPSPDVVDKIKSWVLKYAEEHYNGFKNKEINDSLDEEGIAISRSIKEQLPGCKMEYFSGAFMKKVCLD